jgi:hypothetical protein
MSESHEVCLGDLGLTWQEQQDRFRALGAHFGTLGPEVLRHLQVSAQGSRGDGGALVYHFRTPDGSVFYQDTSGHWSGILRDLRPDVAILAAAGRGVDGEPIRDRLRSSSRVRSICCARATCSSATTTTGCPAPARPIDVKPIRERSSAFGPAPSSSRRATARPIRSSGILS